jgi:hypothetical protein
MRAQSIPRVPLVVTLLVPLAASLAWADSPRPSSVPGLTVANASVVLRGKGTVIRGAAPLGKARELAQLKVTDVLIFKNATGNEVSKEVAELRAAGYQTGQIRHIPFPWREMPGFRKSCELIVDALSLLDRVYRTSRRIAFFHCTKGEDRTGLLAGLFRLLEKGGRIQDVFSADLCARGYEAGASGKPAAVVDTIRRNVTPLFLKVGALIAQGRLRPGALPKSACAVEPALDPVRAAGYVCRP